MQVLVEVPERDTTTQQPAPVPAPAPEPTVGTVATEAPTATPAPDPTIAPVGVPVQAPADPVASPTATEAATVAPTATPTTPPVTQLPVNPAQPIAQTAQIPQTGTNLPRTGGALDSMILVGVLLMALAAYFYRRILHPAATPQRVERATSSDPSRR